MTRWPLRICEEVGAGYLLRFRHRAGVIPIWFLKARGNAVIAIRGCIYFEDETGHRELVFRRQVFHQRFECSGESRMNPLSGIAILAYLLAFGLAVYDRVPITDWLVSHLLPL
jgi:hypothetical protein